MKRLVPVAVLSVVALTLAACGGGDGDGGESAAAPGSTSASSPTGEGSVDAPAGDTESGEPSSGADASTGGDQQFADGKTLTMLVSADPGNLDPQMSSLSATLQFDQFLYDKLLGVDPDGKLVPRLAETWDASATEATFTLREGITCSDGTPLTATDVADNINWVADPDNGSASLGLFVQPGASATADDAARTVTVTTQAPDPFLAQSLGGLYIVCPDGMVDRDVLAKGEAGTGMYTLSESVPGDHYTLERRTDYAWGAGEDFDPDETGRPDTVILKVVENESTAVNLLLSGDANIARVVGPDRDRVASEDLYEVDMGTVLGELWFNHKEGQPTADRAVRTALAQALDLEQLRAVASGGTGTPSTSLINPGMSPCTADNVSGNLPEQDVDAAKAALDGKGLKLTLYFPTSLGPNMQAGAELIQTAWSAVGVDVTIKPMTDTEAAQILLSGQGQWDVAIMPVGLPLPSQLVPFVSGPGAPDGQNFPSVDNAEYTAAVQKAMGEIGEAGCADWNAAEVALLTQVDVIPFANATVPQFGNGVIFELDQGTVQPGSVRMLA